MAWSSLWPCFGGGGGGVGGGGGGVGTREEEEELALLPKELAQLLSRYEGAMKAHKAPFRLY